MDNIELIFDFCSKISTPLFLIPSPQSPTSTSDSGIKSDSYTGGQYHLMFCRQASSYN